MCCMLVCGIVNVHPNMQGYICTAQSADGIYTGRTPLFLGLICLLAIVEIVSCDADSSSY